MALNEVISLQALKANALKSLLTGGCSDRYLSVLLLAELTG